MGSTVPSSELPPRTRRIPIRDGADINQVGTTSAHAENTPPQSPLSASKRNYLRARGEYDPADHPALTEMELPPRTRRILPCATMAAVATGTTSAHAENTWGQGHGYDRGGNYLRARGEYGLLRLPAAGLWELPPRTRRIPHEQSPHQDQCGTTSAHAENTMAEAMATAYNRNYLRARGEYTNAHYPY